MTAPPTNAHRFLDPHLRDWIGLPDVDRVLDPAALSDLLGRTVRVHRLRVKPGRSVLVGWQRTDQESTDRYGWAAVLADRDKVTGVRRRASRAGVAVTVHEPATPTGAAVLLGGLDSDPGLARELAHARRALPATARIEPLAYNPGRRVVLQVDLVPGDGTARQVVRVGADRQDHLIGLARRWRGFGVPTVPVRRVGRRGTAVVSPWWGVGDLAHLPEPAAAERTGDVLARLHRASTVPPRAAAPDMVVPPVAGMVTELLPGLADRVAGLADALDGALSGRRPASLVHGDLSPDQVLWDGADGIRVVDLDRSALGPPGADVGSWVAACTVAGQPELALGFLAGYRSGGSRPGRPLPARELAGWCARALLASALEPFRRADPDWRQRVAAQVALAEDIIAGRGGLP